MRLLRLAPWRPAAALTIRSMGRGILPPATARSQAQLPSLPVPPLDKTAARLVESLRPLLSEKALTAAQQRISTFCAPGGPGPVIQEQLERRALAERNWLASWWEETAYRAYRSSVVVNSNPGVAFGPFTPRVTGAEPREDHAAQIIAGVLQWKLQWDRGGFPVEKFRNRPMCMMQSAKLLSSCRIPREGVDGFEAYTSDESKHFVVVHGGQFFAVDALDSDTDEPLSMSQIAHQLQHIVAAVSTMDHTARAPPVGILTSEHRDSLAFATGILEANPISKASLDKIRSSMFVVCLDEYEPESPSDLLALVLHGKGAEVASHNRWYDKLQLIFSSTGEGGINVEHSPFELVAAANLVDLAAGEFVPKLSDNAGATTCLSAPEHLQFEAPEGIHELLEQAEHAANDIAHSVHMHAFQFDGYGKNFFKRLGLSPDACFQVVLQLAYHKMHGIPCATYETGQTRIFWGGRTETIRSCTTASAAFCDATDNRAESPAHRQRLFREAVETHMSLTREACEGQGVDRHLLGLRRCAEEHGIDTQGFFEDPALVESSHFKLSTSAVAMRHHTFPMFGPTSPDCYGICYNLQDNRILAGLSTFRRDVHAFDRAIRASLAEVQALMEPAKL
eukprot:m.42369 g.42369  ORF g.42369 m.42369 type:complete len:621 (-) comp6090_c0_seq2:3152-5014(-)